MERILMPGSFQSRHENVSRTSAKGSRLCENSNEQAAMRKRRSISRLIVDSALTEAQNSTAASHFSKFFEFSHGLGRKRKLLLSPSTENVKVFGCRPFIDHRCPPREGRRSKTSKEGNRESEGRRRRRYLWGFERRWRLLSSGRNDYQK